MSLLPAIRGAGCRVAGLAALMVAVPVGLLAGCGEDPVEVTAPSPAGRAADQCSTLVAALPERVADEERREVSPDEAAAGAWGDPAIVLRCGVERPAGLRPDSECFVVNDVGWFVAEDTEGVVFTSIGRSTYVEVRVPAAYAPEANALPDLAAPIQQATQEISPCV